MYNINITQLGEQKMKNFKLRAWSKTEKIMSDVKKIDFNNGEIDARSFEETAIEEVELMISTGLFDKKGVEIFEGDVISTYTDNLVIKRDNLLGFYVEVVKVEEKRNYFAETVDIEYLDLFAKDFGVAVEVIGNVYENPELLEE